MIGIRQSNGFILCLSQLELTLIRLYNCDEKIPTHPTNQILKSDETTHRLIGYHDKTLMHKVCAHQQRTHLYLCSVLINTTALNMIQTIKLYLKC